MKIYIDKMMPMICLSKLNITKNQLLKNKGSAIFIHCSFTNLRATAGCVALKKKDIKFLITNLQKKNYIYIYI